jgi:hypothetical protein
MKHQYFGDVNDYRKYGLLRALSGAGGLSIGVCWMLTPADQRTDGRHLTYLRKPAAWRGHDPDLFDFLRSCVIERGRRDVRLIERSGLLDPCVFHSALMCDDTRSRRRYFTAMERRLNGVDLVFFDPDNGMEIASRPLGRRDSRKHLFWHELEAAYDAGRSTLVYQHFPRRPRAAFIDALAETMCDRLGCDGLFSFQTSSVLFVLAAQRAHLRAIRRAGRRVEHCWQGRITHVQNR